MIPTLFVAHVPLIGTNITTMYLAHALDGNHETLIIAFALRSVDCDEAWTWFMRRLKECLGDTTEFGFISHISDSIDYAIRQVYPDSYHGYCCKNIADKGQASTRSTIVEQ